MLTQTQIMVLDILIITGNVILGILLVALGLDTSGRVRVRQTSIKIVLIAGYLITTIKHVL